MLHRVELIEHQFIIYGRSLKFFSTMMHTHMIYQGIIYSHELPWDGVELLAYLT